MLAAAADDGPIYTPSSVVNAASFESGAIAPNSIVTLYGERLSYEVRALRDADVRSNQLPTVLPGSGVRVFIGNTAAAIYYASPRQVNLLVPAGLAPGPVKLWLSHDGRSGPEVPVVLRRAAPALFVMEDNVAIATHADGALATPSRPARPGDVIVLYANGLGALAPPLPAGSIARAASWISRAAEFRIWIAEAPAPPADILYVGAAPGFAGLYQINVRLPPLDRARPEVRIGIGGDLSPVGVTLEASP